MYFHNFLCPALKLEFFQVLGIKLFLTSASNMDSPKAYGPLPSEATYADLTTAAASISEHAKSNGYALFKRSSKQRRVIYTCDRARKPQTKAKNPNIHESKRRERSRQNGPTKTFLDCHGYSDPCEPGTKRERAYMAGISSIYQDDCIEDAAIVAGNTMKELISETQDAEFELDELS
jgi:hypothetical protein